MNKKKCLKCGYVRHPDDDELSFVEPTKCPMCLASYELAEKELLEDEQLRKKLDREYEYERTKQKRELAAQLGSAVARDDILKKSRKNKILLGTASAIVFLIIISVWQDHNEKVNREEMQRQQVIAAEQARTQAEQARIKEEQESAAFIEEYMRELKKKKIHDMVYRRHGIFDHDSEPATKQDVEDIVRRERMLHGND